MIEITNKHRSPVQLVVRSRTAPRAFTTLVVPGIGGKKNIYLLEDERTTEYVARAEKQGLISTRRIPNSRKLN
jgi:hypothetical protein